MISRRSLLATTALAWPARAGRKRTIAAIVTESRRHALARSETRRPGSPPDNVATGIRLQSRRPYSHFSAFAHYIEQMLRTGREPYPPERTLLTAGALSYRAPQETLYARGPVPPAEAGF